MHAIEFGAVLILASNKFTPYVTFRSTVIAVVGAIILDPNVDYLAAVTNCLRVVLPGREQMSKDILIPLVINAQCPPVLTTRFLRRKDSVSRGRQMIQLHLTIAAMMYLVSFAQRFKQPSEVIFDSMGETITTQSTVFLDVLLAQSHRIEMGTLAMMAVSAEEKNLDTECRQTDTLPSLLSDLGIWEIGLETVIGLPELEIIVATEPEYLRTMPLRVGAAVAVDADRHHSSHIAYRDGMLWSWNVL